MNKISKPTLQIYFLIILLISNISLKYCGIVKLFKNKKLDNEKYISITQDLNNQKNGTAISFFGWLKIDKNQKTYHPLLHLSFLASQEELEKETTLSNFALLNYSNNLQSEKSFLTLTFANSKNKWKSEKIPFDIPVDTWFFISYSFDYAKNVVQFHVHYQVDGKEFGLTKKFVTNYPTFFIKKKFQLNIGCFPNDDQNLNHSRNCLNGQSSDFNFTLEYFEDPKFLFLLDSKNQEPVNFNFDVYPKDFNIQKIYSKNHQFFSLDLKGKLNFDQNLNGESMILKGKTEFLLKDVFLFNKNKFNSPTFYFDFFYKEPLPIDLRILQIKRKDSKRIINVNLKKIVNGGKRFLDISIPGTNFKFNSSAIFEENKIQKFSISFIQEKDLFWVFVNHPNEDNYTLKIKLDVLGKSDITFFENKLEFPGLLKLRQINILASASGIIYNQMQPLYNRCDQKCLIFSDLNIKYKKCNKCAENLVFDPENSECKNYCPLGSKNSLGLCVTCSEKNCPELQNKFFKIRKLSPNQYLIERSTYVKMNNFDFKDIFKVAVLRALPNKEFSYTVDYFKGDKSGNTLIYNFKLIDPKKNYNIVFELDPRKIVYSDLGNRIPIFIAMFESLDKNSFPKFEEFKYKKYLDYLKTKRVEVFKKKRNKDRKLIKKILLNLKKDKSIRNLYRNSENKNQKKIYEEFNRKYNYPNLSKRSLNLKNIDPNFKSYQKKYVNIELNNKNQQKDTKKTDINNISSFNGVLENNNLKIIKKRLTWKQLLKKIKENKAKKSQKKIFSLNDLLKKIQDKKEKQNKKNKFNLKEYLKKKKEEMKQKESKKILKKLI